MSTTHKQKNMALNPRTARAFAERDAANVRARAAETTIVELREGLKKLYEGLSNDTAAHSFAGAAKVLLEKAEKAAISNNVEKEIATANHTRVQQATT